MRRVRAIACIALILVVTMLCAGCDTIDKLQVKAGLKNTDFEYIKQGKVNKIVIQNTRDRGFRFVVTDKRAIQDLYNILSSAKNAQTKSPLQPDYVFEMYESHNVVHKFNYIAGLDKKDDGNLYSDSSTYIVSDRIDNDVIERLWTIRIPKNFKNIYYSSILKYIDAYNKATKDSSPAKNPSIGINIDDDVDVAKFILSTDLEEFKNQLQSKGINAHIMSQKDTNKYDIILTIKTSGYKSTLYKSSATFYSNIDKTEKKFYTKYEILGVSGSWKIDLYDDSTKPKNF